MTIKALALWPIRTGMYTIFIHLVFKMYTQETSRPTMVVFKLPEIQDYLY